MGDLESDSTIPPESITPLENDLPEQKLESFTASEMEVQRLREEMAQCREYKDKYLRLLAETENVRKRMQKDKQESIEYAKRDLVLDFLQPIDHLENALKFTNQGSEEVKNWAHGFLMILTQFKNVLSSQRVEAYESVGQHFDPHRHEAVDVVYTNRQAPDTVIEETLKGYAIDGIPLRPARVIVAKAPLAAKEEPQTQDRENNSPS